VWLLEPNEPGMARLSPYHSNTSSKTKGNNNPGDE